MPCCSQVCRPPGLPSPLALLSLGNVAMAAPSGCRLGWGSVVLPSQRERKYSTQISNQGSRAVRMCISGILQTVRPEANTPEMFCSESSLGTIQGSISLDTGGLEQPCYGLLQMWKPAS